MSIRVPKKRAQRDHTTPSIGGKKKENVRVSTANNKNRCSLQNLNSKIVKKKEIKEEIGNRNDEKLQGRTLEL